MNADDAICEALRIHEEVPPAEQLPAWLNLQRHCCHAETSDGKCDICGAAIVGKK